MACLVLVAALHAEEDLVSFLYLLRLTAQPLVEVAFVALLRGVERLLGFAKRFGQPFLPRIASLGRCADNLRLCL